MSPAVFIDANVPVYAAGRDHPLKRPCARILRNAAEDPQSFVTDAEVLQELLHRYLALRRWEKGREVVRALAEILRGRIEPVLARDVLLAAQLADGNATMSARDLLHAATMRRLGVVRIISADSDFDRISGVERLDPARIAEWEPTISAG